MEGDGGIGGHVGVAAAEGGCGGQHERPRRLRLRAEGGTMIAKTTTKIKTKATTTTAGAA